VFNACLNSLRTPKTVQGVLPESVKNNGSSSAFRDRPLWPINSEKYF
jgi:hypothetical protein